MEFKPTDEGTFLLQQQEKLQEVAAQPTHYTL